MAALILQNFEMSFCLFYYPSSGLVALKSLTGVAIGVLSSKSSFLTYVLLTITFELPYLWKNFLVVDPFESSLETMSNVL